MKKMKSEEVGIIYKVRFSSQELQELMYPKWNQSSHGSNSMPGFKDLKLVDWMRLKGVEIICFCKPNDFEKFRLRLNSRNSFPF